MLGGLGESVAGVLSRNYPVRMEMVAVHDTFGESGKPSELLEKYGLGVQNIVDSVLSILQSKKNLNSEPVGVNGKDTGVSTP